MVLCCRVANGRAQHRQVCRDAGTEDLRFGCFQWFSVLSDAAEPELLKQESAAAMQSCVKLTEGGLIQKNDFRIKQDMAKKYLPGRAQSPAICIFLSPYIRS